ncbi:hypothetical protein ACFFWC_04520 [Plantactinospora siamensis]|uniref:DUF2567 domain-containing protein n=1 Tax=Plantactinospora siamensis TaxID=555372 RepID=A0ABV6NRG0_9ACTN
MSYPGSAPVAEADPHRPAAPVRPGRRRPVAVTGAAALLTLMAAVGLVHALIGLSILSGTVARFRSATASTAADHAQLTVAVTLIRGAAALATLIAVGMAVLLGLLALGLLRGTRGSRLAVWAVSAIGLLLGCGALAVTGLQRVVPLDFRPEDLATEQLVRAAAGAYPAWWAPLGAALSTGQALGYLVVALLLALPAANAYFDRTDADFPAADRPVR